jgi:hypothetical protein
MAVRQVRYRSRLLILTTPSLVYFCINSIMTLDIGAKLIL